MLHETTPRYMRHTYSIFRNYLKLKKSYTYISRTCSDTVKVSTHTAAGRYSDLDGVPSWLTHVFQVQRLVGRLVVAPLDGERCGVDANLDRCRPVGVHLSVFVVVALEL